METNYHYQTVARAIRYIRESYPEHPGLEEVADHVHLSKFHFQRLFREWAGVTPKEFLQYLTIERAKRALRLGRSTLEAAYDAGLSGTGRLHDLFVKIEACSPGTFKANGRSLNLIASMVETPFGPACIAETPIGICRMAFSTPESFEADIRRDYPLAGLSWGRGTHANRVSHYFRDWNPPRQGILLHLDGSAFQIQVWRALLQTTPEQLLSYGQLAGAIGLPKASRAVGNAVANNPVAYLIPCHRVILANGHWGNYRWEKERKMAINGYEALALGDS